MSSVFAHPHLFVKSEIKPEIDNNLLTGFKIIWEWDEYWTSDVMAECDKTMIGL